MKKSMLHLIVTALLVITISACGCEKNKMTMTLQPVGKVTINLSGTGKAIIDWGDGSKRETHTLTVFDEYWDEEDEKQKISHHYFGTSVRTITIIGNHITHLGCISLELTSLDISSNPCLIGLVCVNNQLDILDVSKNSRLKFLHCCNNKLTNLVVVDNPMLTRLLCYKNQLIDLDMSKCSALEYLECSYNRFSAEALDALFNTLPVRTEDKKGVILFDNNPGINTCNREIASDKGWSFYLKI